MRDKPGVYSATMTITCETHIATPPPFASPPPPPPPGAARNPLSLYFHLPFCQARCWFCGCNNIITTRVDAAAEYLDDLVAEMCFMARRIDRERPVTQLHLGGGTPTFFPADQLTRFADAVHRLFTFAPGAEISVEIDPRHLDAQQVLAFRVLGARRASLGVQDTDPAVQTAIHRVQPQSVNQRAVHLLREAGFTSINIDLIYGLPRQTPATFERTLDDVLALSPDRLSVFGYAHIPGLKPAQRIFEQQETLPGFEERLALQQLANDRLLAAGYVNVGLDHYARPCDELARAASEGGLHRNFQGYSTRAGASLYAFGISAISSTPDGYWQNHKDLFAYREALAARRLPVERGWRLTPEDHRRRAIVMAIMCDRRLDYAAISREIGVDFARTYASELASLTDLEGDGVVEVNGDGLRVTEAGLPLLRVIAQRFDGYRRTGTHAQPV
ncbi:oxygen-independent coproporphyrinogen III oxidase [Geminisphaera colitermitum]|uniref:oxygen-independent coproporphyrinogen III oxidase n=1 Tax=Geminisphaera colitermitum TaxID=1148786 RepID=UPI001E3DEB8B|nr:oxygen-independent coproporphyrinogen III oxidase [Geminisphaera colitermitum]